LAKKQYKIPTSLDVTYFDMEFNLKTKNGLGVNKPVTAKVVIGVLLAVFGWFYIVFQTFIRHGGLGTIIGFTIVWIVFSVLLIKADKTRRMGLELVFSLINYLPKMGRYVPTRLSDNVYPLQKLYNIAAIDPEDGLIHFADKHIGYVYHVVGSASSLMFEMDKRMILNKVDAFYRKLPVDVEVIYDTVYEGHVVDEQIASVAEDRKRLSVDSPGLKALLDEQHEVLDRAINNHRGLTSLHQYMIVRAPNEELLKEFENLVIGDVESEGLMFRLVRTLSYDEVVRYLKDFFGGLS